MISKRAAEARVKPGVLAVCLMAWHRGDEDVDATAGALIVAEYVVAALKR